MFLKTLKSIIISGLNRLNRLAEKRSRMKKISNKEEKIMENICEAVNNMSDFEKGYLLGVIESRAADKEEKKGKDSKRSKKIK